MLYDQLTHARVYEAIPGLTPAFRYLEALASGAAARGRTELAGGQILAGPVTLTTRPEHDCFYEAHRRYVTVYYAVSGVTGIAVRPVEELEPLEDFNDELDIGLYKGSAKGLCWLHPGEFLVCWPQDAHKIGIMRSQPDPVELAVVKIPADYVSEPSRRILIFGDSNTFGHNPDGGRYSNAVRYPQLLRRMLGPDTEIIEEGLPGRTTVFDDPLREGMSGLACLDPCMHSHTPLDTLVIMLGTNDCKERFGCTSQLIARGLGRLLDKALTCEYWRDKPDILVVAPCPIRPDYGSLAFGPVMGSGCATRAAGLAECFAEVARVKGCRFVDAASFPGVEVHPLDGIHLTADAHRALAEGLYPLLK